MFPVYGVCSCAKTNFLKNFDSRRKENPGAKGGVLMQPSFAGWLLKEKRERNPLNPQGTVRNIYGENKFAVAAPRIAADGQPSLGRPPRPDLSRRFQVRGANGTAIDDRERQWRGRCCHKRRREYRFIGGRRDPRGARPVAPECARTVAAML